MYWLLFVSLFLVGCSRLLSNLPLAEGTVWISDSAEVQQFDPTQLAEIAPHLQQTYPHIFSVSVQRNGEPIYEYYADGQVPDATTPIFSVTKSIASILVGIAIDEGAIESVDLTLAELIPQRIPANADPNVPNITLRQLLTMTSGSYCRNDRCAHNTIEQAMTRKWRKTPGTTFIYDTGVSQIISVVLEEAVGMNMLAYAEAKLFEPMQFADWRWDTNPDGVHGAGEGLHLRPADMMKFGQLILNAGAWEGEQLVSAEYIHEATSNQLSEALGGKYGYLWWLDEAVGNPTYVAIGYGGQFVHITPELDLVVVITADYQRHRDGNDAIIHEMIVPAISIR